MKFEENFVLVSPLFPPWPIFLVPPLPGQKLLPPPAERRCSPPLPPNPRPTYARKHITYSPTTWYDCSCDPQRASQVRFSIMCGNIWLVHENRYKTRKINRFIAVILRRNSFSILYCSAKQCLWWNQELYYTQNTIVFGEYQRYGRIAIDQGPELETFDKYLKTKRRWIVSSGFAHVQICISGQDSIASSPCSCTTDIPCPSLRRSCLNAFPSPPPLSSFEYRDDARILRHGKEGEGGMLQK